MGDYFCPNCGYHRPELKYKVTSVENQTPVESKFDIDNHQYQISVGGTYNIYNALAAYAVGRELGVTPEQIKHAFDANERILDAKKKFMLAIKMSQLF